MIVSDPDQHLAQAVRVDLPAHVGPGRPWLRHRSGSLTVADANANGTGGVVVRPEEIDGRRYARARSPSCPAGMRCSHFLEAWGGYWPPKACLWSQRSASLSHGEQLRGHRLGRWPPQECSRLRAIPTSALGAAPLSTSTAPAVGQQQVVRGGTTASASEHRPGACTPEPHAGAKPPLPHGLA